MMSNAQKGKWFKFNDTVVEEFEMTEDNLEAECFGGTYKAKIIEPSKKTLLAKEFLCVYTHMYKLMYYYPSKTTQSGGGWFQWHLQSQDH